MTRGLAVRGRWLLSIRMSRSVGSLGYEPDRGAGAVCVAGIGVGDLAWRHRREMAGPLLLNRWSCSRLGSGLGGRDRRLATPLTESRPFGDDLRDQFLSLPARRAIADCNHTDLVLT